MNIGSSSEMSSVTSRRPSQDLADCEIVEADQRKERIALRVMAGTIPWKIPGGSALCARDKREFVIAVVKEAEDTAEYNDFRKVYG